MIRAIAWASWASEDLADSNESMHQDVHCSVMSATTFRYIVIHKLPAQRIYLLIGASNTNPMLYSDTASLDPTCASSIQKKGYSPVTDLPTAPHARYAPLNPMRLSIWEPTFCTTG